ncbi:hypothetical protein BGW39_010269, partial [Mortierella sp. 14UC]
LQQQSSQHLYSNHPQQQPQQPSTLHTHKNSSMGQQQNLEQIREETVMESFMAGVESGEYFAQLQLQSPQLPQAPYSLQSQSSYDYSGNNMSNNGGMAVSTPLLASQSQTVYDLSGNHAGESGMATTPTVASSSLSSAGLMTSSMDGSSGYAGGYPQFPSSANPLFSSPPISSSGAFSPTMPSMSNYFTHQPMTSTSSQRHQFFSNNIIIPPGGTLPTMSPNSDTQMTGDHSSSNAYMAESQDSKAWLWESYPTTNPTPSVEVLMQMQQQEQQQQHHQQQQQQQYQLNQQQQELSSSGGSPAQQQPFMLSQPPPHPFYQQTQDHLQSPPLSAIQPGYTVSSPVTTPPTTPQRHPRLFHSQSQPGLRNLQQQQQKQQILQQQHQQHGLRHRQHSVHFTGGGFVTGDLGGMRTTRHVSLPVGSYSAPIPSLASLSEMMQDSPLGSAGGNAPYSSADLSTTLAETTTLLSMSLPSSTHGYSFLDGPPPPMHHHHHHHHFLPTSPPLSSADLSGASTPTTPKSRSRAGSKSRSRPSSASSVVSVRNAGAPYSPSITNTSGPISVAAASRSPSLVPLSPIPPFKLGDDADPTSPPPNSYDSGMILVASTPGAAGNATGASPSGGVAAGTTTGGKARRISRTKLPTKSRSRSSTLTASNAGSGLVAGLPAEAVTGNLATSPFSLVLSEQEEAELQGLADASAESLQHHRLQQQQQQQLHVQSVIELAPSGSQPGEDIDPFQLDATVPMHQHQQYQHLDPAMLDMSSSAINDLDGVLDEDYEGEDGMDEDGGAGGEDGSTPGAEESSSSANTNPTGKPIPCPIPSCSKTFARPFNLNAHVKSHDVLKPYGCHLCSRVFSRKHDLQRHIRVHTGSKPYVCVNCQKAFARTDALCRHYKCEEACREFMQQDEVRKQAQQNVQHSLHQEQIELQQAQQAFALARQQEAEARATAAAAGGYVLDATTATTTEERTGADVVDEMSFKSVIIKANQDQQQQQPKLRRVSTITSLSAASMDSKTTVTTTIASSSSGTGAGAVDGSSSAAVSQQDS